MHTEINLVSAIEFMNKVYYVARAYIYIYRVGLSYI